MPQVGNKHYAYTPKGIAQAKKTAAKSGKQLKMAKPAKKGGKKAY